MLQIFFYFYLLLYATSDVGSRKNVSKNICPLMCNCFSINKDVYEVTHVNCAGAALVQLPLEIPASVQTLDLRHNHITRLNVTLLKQLNSLHTIFLADNRIQHLDEDFLDELPEIRRLYLSRNQLRRLPRFSKIYDQSSIHAIDLHANKLIRVPSDAFSNLRQLMHLNFARNFLQSLPEKMLSENGRLESFHLENNPWACDCRIRALSNYLQTHKLVEENSRHHNGNISVNIRSLLARCRFPENLRNVPLRDINLSDMTCIKPRVVRINNTFTMNCIFKEEDLNGKSANNIEWLYKNAPIFEEINGDFELLENGSLLIRNSKEVSISFIECARNYPAEIFRHLRQTRDHFQNENENFDQHHLSLQNNNNNRHNSNLNFRIGAYQPQQTQEHRSSQQRSSSQQQMKFNKQQSSVFTENYHTKNEMAIEESAPRFTYVSRDRSFREGSAATLNCEVVGRPLPHIIWRFSPSKNSGTLTQSLVIEESRKFRLHNNGTELVIFPFLDGDVGHYSCEAANKYGSITASASIGIVRARAPTITEGPKNLNAHVGQKVILKCQARGEPQPIITWLFDGSEISATQNNGHYKISDDSSELTLQQITRHDKGTYSCMAGNSVGSMTADAQLNVETSQLDALDFNLNEQLLDGIVNEASKNINKAISETKSELERTSVSTPQELFRHFKFATKHPVELTKAREIYEESLRLIQKHVEKGLRLKPTDMSPNISYESVLSVTHIQTIMELSGCMNGQFRESCNDMCFHSKYRTYTGQCNNFEHPTWGVSQMPFYRLLPPIYENGFNTPVGWDPKRLYFGFPKPNPRTVSIELIQTREITPHHRLSAMLMQWGQFIDHDMDFTATALARQTYAGGAICNRTCENNDPCFNIPLPLNDPRRTADMKFPCIEFERSAAICGSGETSPIFHHISYREQTNTITSFIDASNVYGSTEVDAIDLRDLYGDHGLLRFDIVSGSQKPYMPFEKDSAMDCRRNRSVDNPIRCFLSGDVRANEQLGLTAMHTIWFREHNRIAAKLLEMNADWDGERIYQEARKIVGAMMQHITFEHWLPKVIGREGYDNLIGTYQGYVPTVNPSISNAFATAAFRFGHTVINPRLERLDENFETISAGPLMLHDAFFAPERLLSEGGIDPIIRGLFASPMKKPKPNQLLNVELTEKLFNRAHNVSLDLAVMNIQRGRDHGLPGYMEYRSFCNLTTTDSWEKLALDIGDDTVLAKLKMLYGHTGNIDLFVGGIVERRLADALVGPTFSCIIADQFRRVRAGDRFWYENPSIFTPLQLNQLKKTTLAKVLCNNGDSIHRVQTDVFFHVGDDKKENLKLRYRKCDELPDIDLRMWMSCCESTCNTRDEENAAEELSRPKRMRRAHHLYKPIMASMSIINGTKMNGKNDIDFCVEDGRQIRNGESWTAGRCRICKCEDGSIWCSKLKNCTEEE